VAALLRFSLGGLAQFVASFGAAAATIIGRGNVGDLNSTLDSVETGHGCGCAATQKMSRPCFRRSTISARRLGISRLHQVGNAA